MEIHFIPTCSFYHIYAYGFMQYEIDKISICYILLSITAWNTKPAMNWLWTDLDFADFQALKFYGMAVQKSTTKYRSFVVRLISSFLYHTSRQRKWNSQILKILTRRFRKSWFPFFWRNLSWNDDRFQCDVRSTWYNWAAKNNRISSNPNFELNPESILELMVKLILCQNWDHVERTRDEPNQSENEIYVSFSHCYTSNTLEFLEW